MVETFIWGSHRGDGYVNTDTLTPDQQKALKPEDIYIKNPDQGVFGSTFIKRDERLADLHEQALEFKHAKANEYNQGWQVKMFEEKLQTAIHEIADITGSKPEEVTAALDKEPKLAPKGFFEGLSLTSSAKAQLPEQEQAQPQQPDTKHYGLAFDEPANTNKSPLVFDTPASQERPNFTKADGRTKEQHFSAVPEVRPAESTLENRKATVVVDAQQLHDLIAQGDKKGLEEKINALKEGYKNDPKHLDAILKTEIEGQTLQGYAKAHIDDKLPPQRGIVDNISTMIADFTKMVADAVAAFKPEPQQGTGKAAESKDAPDTKEKSDDKGKDAKDKAHHISRASKDPFAELGYKQASQAEIAYDSGNQQLVNQFFAASAEKYKNWDKEHPAEHKDKPSLNDQLRDLATKGGTVAAITALMEKGANAFSKQENGGPSAVELAHMNGHKEFVAAMFEANKQHRDRHGIKEEPGVKVTPHDAPPAPTPADGDKNISSAPKSLTDQLREAVVQGNTKENLQHALELIGKGADPKEKGPDGKDAYTLAATHGNKAWLEHMQGASVEARNREIDAAHVKPKVESVAAAAMPGAQDSFTVRSHYHEGASKEEKATIDAAAKDATSRWGKEMAQRGAEDAAMAAALGDYHAGKGSADLSHLRPEDMVVPAPSPMLNRPNIGKSV